MDGEPHSWAEYARLASNAVSAEDIEVLRHSLRRPPAEAPQSIREIAADNAGYAVLALFTRAGYCDLAYDVRPWFISPRDPGDEIFVAGSTVLEACVSGFGDGNALRVLYEFADDEMLGLRVALNNVLQRIDCAPEQLLKRTRAEQIGQLMADHGEPILDTAALWNFRTYIDDDRVHAAFVASAEAGHLFAVIGLLFRGAPVPWDTFEKTNTESADEQRLFINAVLENVRLGADASYCNRDSFRSRIDLFAAELEQGLKVLGIAN